MKYTFTAFFASFLLILATSLQAQSYAKKPSEISPVLTGSTIPNSSLQTIDGSLVNLENLINKQATVLVFYHGGWCPFCNTHLAELQQIQQKLVDMGYQILAVSPDKPSNLKKSIKENDLDYTLLSDSSMKLARSFGLAFKSNNEEKRLTIEKSSGQKHHLLPVPSVFLVNPDGLITFQYVNPNSKTRINSDVLLTAAKAYHPNN
ncbi:Peroxiredoxin [Fodinibius salinus]|uniref:thioredoxin-dependent peroxiredoxin n=1 Tax=Fodinibius salinus TaxID=860790 RepID=A0A5D3YHG6_9BACT|nr:peroxiredoxin-like family protein [Fodinibius salinus]TYP91969.1 Peroxiredoxin [Fodinibius salinus]